MTERPTIRRLTYQEGMLERLRDAKSLPSTVLEGESLSQDLINSVFDNDLLALGGEYGNPDVGKPIQYDRLLIETDRDAVDIKVYNRAIMMFHKDEDLLTRIHRVCCKVDSRLQREA